MTFHRRAATAAWAIAGIIGLSACGSDLGPDMHPGTAAIVGEHRISIDEVDRKAEEFCALAVGANQINGEVPMASLRNSYLQTVVDWRLAKQFLEEYDEADNSTIKAQVQAADEQSLAVLAQLPPETHDIFTEMSSMSNLINVVHQVGGESFQQWLAEADVVTDPRFTVAVGNEERGETDSLSVAVSDFARAVAGAEDQQQIDDYIDALPASQTCSSVS